MARNEQELKSRWQSAYRNSGEYQAAQRRDAIAKVTRDRQGRDAMRAALERGDAMKAAAIQSALQREDARRLRVRGRSARDGRRIVGKSARSRARRC